MNTNTLPAFLRQHDGLLELVLHCTWSQDFERCQKLFELRYAHQLETTGPRPALNYGAAVHSALALRYKNPGESLADIEDGQMTLLDHHFEAAPQPTDEWRSVGRTQDLIRAYNAAYPAEEWEVLAVEQDFEVEVGSVELTFNPTDDTGQQTHYRVFLAGRKDLVVSWHGGLWVVDHKTAQDWGRGESNSHIDEGRMSFQFRGYAWAEREAAEVAKLLDPDSYAGRLRVLGTAGNYLISRKPYASEGPKNGRSALPRNEFHRECYPYSDRILDEWRLECLGLAEDVLRCWANGWWRCTGKAGGGCGHWGRCEFYELCEADPSQRELLMAGSEYRHKELGREL